MAVNTSIGNQSTIKDAFQRQKAVSLSGIDYSKKGSIDKPIVNLVSFINRSEDFFTTSSCSGRVAVISEGKEKKKHCQWLFMSHDEVLAKDLINSLQGTEPIESAVLKYESFVIHVQCRTLEKGQEMLQIALQAGFRNSGLVIGRKKRIMLAVRSTHVMEVPLIFDEVLMVSEEYITKTVELCNNKMKENIRRINRFFDEVRNTYGENKEDNENHNDVS